MPCQSGIVLNAATDSLPDLHPLSLEPDNDTFNHCYQVASTGDFLAGNLDDLSLCDMPYLLGVVEAFLTDPTLYLGLGDLAFWRIACYGGLGVPRFMGDKKTFHEAYKLG